MNEVEKKYSPLKIVHTITDTKHSKNKWEGESGYITSEMIKKYIKNTSTPTYYVVGPPKMVDAMFLLLKDEMKIPEDQIEKEGFGGY